MATWPSMDAARGWTCQPHILVNGSENILIVDCATGEVDML